MGIAVSMLKRKRGFSAPDDGLMRSVVKQTVRFAENSHERRIELDELFPVGYEKSARKTSSKEVQATAHELKAIDDNEVFVWLTTSYNGHVDFSGVECVAEVVDGAEIVDEVTVTKTEDGPDQANCFADKLLMHLIKARIMNIGMIRNAVANFAISGELSTEAMETTDPHVETLRMAVHAKMTYLSERLEKYGKVVLLPSTSVYRHELQNFFGLCVKATASM